MRKPFFFEETNFSFLGETHYELAYAISSLENSSFLPGRFLFVLVEWHQSVGILGLQQGMCFSCIPRLYFIYLFIFIHSFFSSLINEQASAHFVPRCVIKGKRQFLHHSGVTETDLTYSCGLFQLQIMKTPLK